MSSSSFPSPCSPVLSFSFPTCGSPSFSLSSTLWSSVIGLSSSWSDSGSISSSCFSYLRDCGKLVWIGVCWGFFPSGDQLYLGFTCLRFSFDDEWDENLFITWWNLIFLSNFSKNDDNLGIRNLFFSLWINFMNLFVN